MGNLFARKPLDKLMEEAQEVGEHSLKRSLGPMNLIALGIGGIIGAGLFVRTAAAIAERAGPSVVLAFIVAGLGRALCGLCFGGVPSPSSGGRRRHPFFCGPVGGFVGRGFAWGPGFG